MSPSSIDSDDALFLGLDCSTQSMSAVVVDAVGHLVHECSFRFDDRFPQYDTDNGVLRPTTDEVVVPSLLFVESLDAILDELKKSSSVDTAKIKSVSGSAQQHASVYWHKDFSLRTCLDVAAESNTLSLLEAMKQQTHPAFCLPNGPSWMDSSTTRYCTELEAALGGPDQVAEISGSRAYPRFTGNQIAKRIHEDPALLEKCGRIALISSMLTSLLYGNYAPIDDSDGSGMNLLDVRKRVWSPELLRATTRYSNDANAAAQLETALGPQVSRAYSPVGVIHAYFQKKYGFAADCKVVPFSGDNPCTLAGIGLSQPGDVGVSGGTSTTLFAVVPTNAVRFTGNEGHFFCNPIDPNTFMAMICFKNGSLTRQEVRDRCAGGSWETFEELMQATRTGNDDVTVFYYQDSEITPSTRKAGVVGFDASSSQVDPSVLPPEVEIRAVVESQFMSLRLHAERLGVNKPWRLVVVGGASTNKCMLQVLANVFDTQVYRLACTSHPAALGGAFRACHGFACANSVSGYVPFDVSDSLDFSLSASPIADAAKVYTHEIPRFESLEDQAVSLLS
uniref:Xylulose kinase n=1 Tax=Hyaloperonospora arabidopsidis TaxID=272952 RepID=A0A7G1GEQ0_HYAAB|nr:xylulose kinase [Hyaloperonospora arabidopsidis]